MTQLDLFAVDEPKPTNAELREEARFGRLDAITGLPRVNYYSARIAQTERLAAYDQAWRAARNLLRP